MPDGPITIESGRIEWPTGYAAPADSAKGAAGPPAGWDETPDFDALMRAKATAGQPQFQSAVPEEQRPMQRQTAQEVITAALKLPSERVNLDEWTAVFRGHEIVLAPQERDAIKLVLSSAVVRQLDEERARVLNELQLETMQTAGGAGGQDVPAVPGPPQPLEPESPRTDGEV